MRYAISSEGREARQRPDDTVAELALIDGDCGCEIFAQRLLRFGAGGSAVRVEPDADEVAYVLAGSGRLTVEGEAIPVAAGTAVFVRRGSHWELDCEGPLELVSVLVRDPEPAPAPFGVVELGAADRSSATSAREFSLGVGPAVGCTSVTQFIGFVPVGRAPDHFHRYDEVLYILRGQGVVHIGEEEARLETGACVHLPAGLVHCLENTGPGELELLGVFRPAGSPAEAYYPDGRPAPTPAEA
jgi:mannose-6-phosphate isomerase-like protein (cupin superfamily)